MQRKVIGWTIKKAINPWLKSLPEKLREDIKDDIIVTGGSIASMLMQEDVNDFDVYFSKKSSALTVAKHYAALCNLDVEDRDDRIAITGKVGPQEIEKKEDKKGDDRKYRPVHFSANAITLDGDIQIIVRFWGSPEEIHENFDFVHCTCYWTSLERKVVLNVDALESMMSKMLKYRGSLYPVASILRLKKFLPRGWRVSAGDVAKMAIQVSELNLLDPDVLRDQLTGVDLQYFEAVLESIKDKKAIDSEMLSKELDKAFGLEGQE